MSFVCANVGTGISMRVYDDTIYGTLYDRTVEQSHSTPRPTQNIESNNKHFHYNYFVKNKSLYFNTWDN